MPYTTIQHTPDERLEIDETLAYLRLNGFGPVLDALEDEAVYTSKGKLNRSALARKLNTSPVKVNEVLSRLRNLAHRA